MTRPKREAYGVCYGKPLSARELEVLILIARGHTSAVIAKELGVTQNTIRTTCMRMFIKLGVRTRAQAVAVGCYGGIIPAPADTAPLPEPLPPRGTRTDVHISADLADEVLYVVGHAAAGVATDALRAQARRVLGDLHTAADKLPIPSQRNRDSRP